SGGGGGGGGSVLIAGQADRERACLNPAPPPSPPPRRARPTTPLRPSRRPRRSQAALRFSPTNGPTEPGHPLAADQVRVGSPPSLLDPMPAIGGCVRAEQLPVVTCNARGTLHEANRRMLSPSPPAYNEEGVGFPGSPIPMTAPQRPRPWHVGERANWHRV
ncbi:Protein of unknown function, partial [Gryllus bimaculatus]